MRRGHGKFDYGFRGRVDYEAMRRERIPEKTDRTIAISVFLNAAVFFAAALAGQTQTITATSYAGETDTFGTATITRAAIPVTPALFTNAQTFGSAALVPGAAAITGTLFSDLPDTFGLGSIGLGSSPTQGLAPALYTDADSFNSSAVKGLNAVTPALFTDADTFNTATVVPGAVAIAGTLFTDADTFNAAAVSSSFTLPAGAAAIYSVKKISGASETRCVRVVRASDSAEQDIGYGSDGWLDMTAAEAFRGSSSLSVKVWYDQSGNGNHTTAQTVAASRPALDVNAKWRGLPCMSFDLDALALPSAVVADRANATLLSVVASQAQQNSPLFLGTSGTDRFGLNSDVSSNALQMRLFNAATTNTTVYARAQPQVLAVSSGGSGLKIHIDESVTSAAALPTQATAGGWLGRDPVGSYVNGQLDALFHAIYSTALNDATMTATKSTLYSVFDILTTYDTQIIFDGDSGTFGQNSTANLNYPRQAEPSFSRRVAMVNLGVGGQAIATMYANRATPLGHFISGKTNILHIMGGSNDLNTATAGSGSTLWTSATLPYIQAAKTAGFKVIVGTILDKGSFDAVTRPEMLAYNQAIRDNAASVGYAVADYYNIPELQGYTNLTYFNADQAHLTTAGYAKQAVLTASVANIALAPDTTAPTITSSATFSIAENSAFSQQLTANETVTWTKTGGADTSLFTLTSGGLLTMAAKDFEIPTDANADNAYIVQVTATDAASNATNQTITVTVTDVVEGSNLAETTALIARMTTAPNSTRTTQINTLIAALKTGATSSSDIWSKLDLVYVFAAHDAQAGLLNWKGSTLGGTLTASNSPAFTVDRGYAGNGTNASLDGPAINTLVQATQNSRYFSVGVRSVSATANNYIVGASTSPQNALAVNISTQMLVRNGGTTAGTWTTGTLTGRFSTNRTTSADYIAKRNNGTGTTFTSASAAPSTQTLALLRTTTLFGDPQISYFAIGGSLTAAEQTDFDDAIAAYLTAVGA